MRRDFIPEPHHKAYLLNKNSPIDFYTSILRTKQIITYLCTPIKLKIINYGTVTFYT